MTPVERKVRMQIIKEDAKRAAVGTATLVGIVCTIIMIFVSWENTMSARWGWILLGCIATTAVSALVGYGFVYAFEDPYDHEFKQSATNQSDPPVRSIKP